MDIRKQKEIEYYDKNAENWLKTNKKEKGDFEGFNCFLLKSYGFLYNFLKDKCRNKEILDYGCGNGVHSVWLSKCGGKITAIDLSEKSLEIAKEKAKRERIENKIEFLKMDCETMTFENNAFDIIFDGGTFSSLDLKKALPELARVLKSDGFLVGIETFGHNPLTNLKRKFNKITGRRTEWAAEHILKTKDLEIAKNYFNKIEIRYFHLISWISFPFLKLPGGKLILKLLESIDRILFCFRFLRKYAFKVVFIFSQPRK